MATNVQDENEINAIELKDILDISVLEMIILQSLVSFPSESFDRKSLLGHLNGQILRDQTLPTSTFYDKLKRLKNKDLITYTKVKGRKSQPIKLSNKSELVLGEIRKLSVAGLTNIFEILEVLIPKFAEAAKINKKFENLLVINMEPNIDPKVIETIGTFSEKTYLLEDDSTYQIFVDRGLDPKIISQSKFADGKIREPEEFFDACMILGYGMSRDYHYYNHKHWLEETLRVLKKQGIITLSSVEELPETNHYIIDGIIRDLQINPSFNPVNKEQLIDDISELGIVNHGILEHNGFLLTWGNRG